MQKQILLRLMYLFMPTMALAQETNVQITEKISIVFPGPPKERDIQGVAKQYTLRLADSSANFNALVTNLEKSNGFTADVLAAAQWEAGFWEQTEAAFIGQLEPGTTVTKREVKAWNGRQTLMMEVHTIARGKPADLTVYIFLDGVYTINLLYSKRSDKADANLRNQFFASLATAK